MKSPYGIVRSLNRLLVAVLALVVAVAPPSTHAQDIPADSPVEQSSGDEGTKAAPSGPDADDTRTITITGERPAIEQGERSLFQALPPRDLVRRPLTATAGLETAHSVVGREEIEWLDADSLVDALEYVPGAWTERRGRKVKEFFSIRGQRYPYPEYLIDGAWFREFHEISYFLSAANVDRLEVLRSSADLILGPGGMVGLINVIPRTYQRRRTELFAGYGSDDTWRTRVNHGDTVGRLAYALGLGYYHTDGPHNENAEENIANFYGRAQYAVNDDLTVSLTGFVMDGDRELQLAEPPAQAALQTRVEYYDPMRAYVGIARAHYQPSDNYSTDVIFNYAKRRFHGHRVGNPSWLEEDYEYGARVVQTVLLCEENTLRVSGLYNRWKSPTGKRFYVGNKADLETFAGMISDEHRFGNLTVEAGYRISRTHVHDFGGFNVEGAAGRLRSVTVHDEWEDPLHTVALGATYQLTDQWSVHSHVSYEELAVRRGLLNVDLEAPGSETRIKYDLGVTHEWPSFGQATVAGFFVDQKDAPIVTNNTVTVDGVDYGLYTSGDKQVYGVEAGVQTRRFDCGLQFFANATAMTTRMRTSNGWTDDREVPDVIIGGGASYLVGDCEFGVLTKHVSAYENDRFLPGGAAPADLGGFTEINAHVNYYFGKEKQHRAFLGVDNVTDREYSTVAGWPDEGRKWKMGMALSF